MDADTIAPDPIYERYWKDTDLACDLIMSASKAIKAGDVDTWNRLTAQAVKLQQAALDRYYLEKAAANAPQ